MVSKVRKESILSSKQHDAGCKEVGTKLGQKLYESKAPRVLWHEEFPTVYTMGGYKRRRSGIRVHTSGPPSRSKRYTSMYGLRIFTYYVGLILQLFIFFRWGRFDSYTVPMVYLMVNLMVDPADYFRGGQDLMCDFVFVLAFALMGDLMCDSRGTLKFALMGAFMCAVLATRMFALMHALMDNPIDAFMRAFLVACIDLMYALNFDLMDTLRFALMSTLMGNFLADRMRDLKEHLKIRPMSALELALELAHMNTRWLPRMNTLWPALVGPLMVALRVPLWWTLWVPLQVPLWMLAGTPVYVPWRPLGPPSYVPRCVPLWVPLCVSFWRFLGSP
eukprot:gene11-12821_t